MVFTIYRPTMLLGIAAQNILATP